MRSKARGFQPHNEKAAFAGRQKYLFEMRPANPAPDFKLRQARDIRCDAKRPEHLCYPTGFTPPAFASTANWQEYLSSVACRMRANAPSPV